MPRLLNTGGRIEMRIELTGAAAGTEGLERPFIGGFVVAQDVGVAVVGLDAEVRSFRTIPLVIDRFDEVQGFTEPKLDRPLIGFVAGITFHSKLHAPSYHLLLIPVRQI